MLLVCRTYHVVGGRLEEDVGALWRTYADPGDTEITMEAQLAFGITKDKVLGSNPVTQLMLCSRTRLRPRCTHARSRAPAELLDYLAVIGHDTVLVADSGVESTFQYVYNLVRRHHDDRPIRGVWPETTRWALDFQRLLLWLADKNKFGERGVPASVDIPSMHKFLNPDEPPGPLEECAAIGRLVQDATIWAHLESAIYAWSDFEMYMERKHAQIKAGILRRAENARMLDTNNGVDDGNELYFPDCIDNWKDVPTLPWVDADPEQVWIPMDAGDDKRDHAASYMGKPAGSRALDRTYATPVEAIEHVLGPVFQLLVEETNLKARLHQHAPLVYNFLRAVVSMHRLTRLGKLRGRHRFMITAAFVRLRDWYKTKKTKNPFWRTAATRAQHPRAWKPVTPLEMRIFFARLVHMGLLGAKRSVRAYWSKDPMYTPEYLKPFMSLTRFEQIKRFLHFSDDREAPVRGAPGFDPLYKIRRLQDVANESFLANYTIPRSAAIDESMWLNYCATSTTTKHPGKTHDTGHFIWVMASHQPHPYVHCFRVRMTANKWDMDKQGGKFFGTHIVMKLVALAGIEGSDRVIVTDNYYTSVQLANTLRLNGLHSLGMLRSARVPEAIKLSDEQKKVKGSSRYARTTTGIAATGFMDSEDIYLLTTCYDNAAGKTIERWDTDDAGNKVRVRFETGEAVERYNLEMGSVDLVRDTDPSLGCCVECSCSARAGRRYPGEVLCPAHLRAPLATEDPVGRAGPRHHQRRSVLLVLHREGRRRHRLRTGAAAHVPRAIPGGDDQAGERDEGRVQRGPPRSTSARERCVACK